MLKKSNLPSSKFFCSLGVCGLTVLSGCSIRGTYVDPNGPDTAKLRFVVRANNATLDYFDADNCSGKTTGLLNNLFFLDTGRRVGMKSPPSNDAYLEIKVDAGRDIFLSLNSLDTIGRSCALAMNFTAQKEAEYELTMLRIGNWCGAALARLQELDGEIVRSREPISRATSFPACAGRGPQFLNPPN
jgi:hypothetical protein